MPKVLEDLARRLAEEARRQVQESGYAALTVRSVAKACGVGVGTVYNYYPSKESLAAAYMLRDWETTRAALLERCAAAPDARGVLYAVYAALLDFRREHAALFRDESAKGSYPAFSARYHGTLRDALAEPLQKICPDAFTAVFTAEALLAWSAEGQDFETLYGVLAKIIL